MRMGSYTIMGVMGVMGVVNKVNLVNKVETVFQGLFSQERINALRGRI